MSSSSSPAPAASRSETPLHVYLAGVGAVGSALLRQIDARDPSGRPLRLLGACTSRYAAWVGQDQGAQDVLDGTVDTEALDWPAIMDRLTRVAPRPLVFVDATGHPEVADRYERLLRAGIHVVTPSKLANTRSQAQFDRLHAGAAEAGVQYRYETTVGAGLPVVQTVRDLVATGDRIHQIRGAASGTLTFVFSVLREGATFSEAVRAAIDRGYAEPDVRDDLSGEDVARKMLILARTAGWALERGDVQVESLVPEPLAETAYDTFLDRLDTADDQWRDRCRAAAADGAVLQYVGRLSGTGVEVGVRAVPKDTDFGRLTGQDNLFAITTDRYDDIPLLVRGPGAGPAVTAAGVLADVLAVGRSVRTTSQMGRKKGGAPTQNSPPNSGR